MEVSPTRQPELSATPPKLNSPTLNPPKPSPTHRNYVASLFQDVEGLTDSPLKLLLVFDEAHDLALPRPSLSDPKWSLFVELRRALHQLNDEALFSLFLSTAGHLHHFTPAKSMDPSARIQDGKMALIEPFVELDFDTFAQPIEASKKHLKDVTKIEHLVSLGRPL